MKADELEQRLKNALIYGTSHPEAYMTKTDELWEKYARNGLTEIGKVDFLDALTEYGEHVRAEAVKVCGKRSIELAEFGAKDLAAASAADSIAISKMELP